MTKPLTRKPIARCIVAGSRLRKSSAIFNEAGTIADMRRKCFREAWVVSVRREGAQPSMFPASRFQFKSHRSLQTVPVSLNCVPSAPASTDNLGRPSERAATVCFAIVCRPIAVLGLRRGAELCASRLVSKSIRSTRSGRQEEDKRDQLAHNRNETNEDPPAAQVRIVETADRDCGERHNRRTHVESHKIRTDALYVRFEQRAEEDNQCCEKGDPPKVFATRAAPKTRVVLKVASNCVDHGQTPSRVTVDRCGLFLVG
jgi:hypothetical protein